MNTSPFSKLPPELRNRIYELALRHPQPFVIFRRQADSIRGAVGSEDGQGEGKSLSLLSTCKAVNMECAQLFYAVNDFTFMDRGAFGARDVRRRFRRTIGDDNAAALRSVSFDVGTSTTYMYRRGTMLLTRESIYDSVAEAEAHPDCTFQRESGHRLLQTSLSSQHNAIHSQKITLCFRFQIVGAIFC